MVYMVEMMKNLLKNYKIQQKRYSLMLNNFFMQRVRKVVVVEFYRWKINFLGIVSCCAVKDHTCAKIIT